jgi:hypothetical protein
LGQSDSVLVVVNLDVQMVLEPSKFFDLELGDEILNSAMRVALNLA